MANTNHDKIAKELAETFGTKYNKGKGPDIKTKNKVIEVVTHESDLYSSIKQIGRYQKPKYFAVPNKLVNKAKEITKGTGIGLITPTGIIKKKSRNKK